MAHLLDTNHCSRIIEADEAVLNHMRANENIIVAISVIVQGELIMQEAQPFLLESWIKPAAGPSP